MAAVTRWVQYSVDAVGTATLGRDQGGKGTRGYSIGTADPGDEITIGPTTNRLHIAIDGDPGYITLYSGANLDPRFVARNITEKLHDAGKSDERWDNAICVWENVTISGTGVTNRNRFKIYSGTLGAGSSITISGGTNSAHTVLGFNTKSETGGSANPDGKAGGYTFGGDISVSGTYTGFLDEVYKIVISNDNSTFSRGIGTPSKGGTNSYTGTISTNGVFNFSSDITYSIEIDTTNGTTMGGGTGNVPRMRWTSTGGDSQTDWTELLYPEYWYNVGSYGLMVKFTDAVFNTCSDPNYAWTIACYKPDYAQGTNASAPVGLAQYVYASDRGDASSAPITTVSGVFTTLGDRGLSIKFNPSGGADNLGAGDCFYVICSAPKPSSYNITSLNYGNVTVSTESPVKCVMFEIESGAVQMSTVRFGLQSHGTFQHHNAGNSDTYFRFGTVGPGETPATNSTEWYQNVVAADIDNDVAPSYLASTKANLSVVSTADDSQDVGNYPLRGMISDPMWVCIRLGASETGANSTINYRLYFDYA
jgi:hypothetical protein